MLPLFAALLSIAPEPQQQHALQSSSEPPLGDQIWATLLTGASVNATLQVEHQIVSVRRFSAYSHVTLCTSDVPESERARLRKAGSAIIDVERLDAARPTPDSWFSDIYTKLRIFNMTQFATIAYVDSDAILLDERADRIFTACAEQGDPPLCGVRDQHNTTEGFPMVNGGVLVVQPSAEDYAQLVAALQTRILGRFNEQELLAVHYASRLRYLPAEFNSCNLNEGTHVDGAYILHACGDVKVNELPLCAWEVPSREIGYRAARWKARPAASMCRSHALKLAQSMLLEARPCLWHNHDPAGHACAAAEGCGWCGFEMGCTESAQCHLDSAATQAMITRRRTAPKTTWGKWSVLSETDPQQFKNIVPRYWNTLVTVAIQSCNRLPFLHLALDQINENRRHGNPDGFGVSLEVLLVDDSPANSSTGRQIVQELSERWPRFHLLREEDVPDWRYANRSITLLNGEVLPHVSADGAAMVYHHADQSMVVRLLRLNSRRTIGEKRTLAARAARGHIIQHWDDDDLLPPQAIWQNMLPLLHGVSDVVSLSFDWFFVLPTGQFWRQHPDKCVAGLGSMAYLRSVAAELEGFSNVELSEDVDFVERALQGCHRFLIRDCYDRGRSGYVYTRHGSLSGKYSGSDWPELKALGHTAQDSTYSFDATPPWMKAVLLDESPEWLSESVKQKYRQTEWQVVNSNEVCTAPSHEQLAQPKAVADLHSNSVTAGGSTTFPRMPARCCATALEANVDDGCWSDFFNYTHDRGHSGFSHYSRTKLVERSVGSVTKVRAST